MSADLPICLVGLRCTGKSTLGALLAEHLRRPFIDLDDELAGAFAVAQGSAEVPPAGEVLEQIGEPAFRELECAALERCCALQPPAVIATGGGCVVQPTARAVLSSRALTLWLAAEPAILAQRLRLDPTLRPSLTGADPALELSQLEQQRGPLYAESSQGRFDASLPLEALLIQVLDFLAQAGAGPQPGSSS